MNWFGLPASEYSFDGGKTWRRDGPLIGANVIMRIITADGQILFKAHAESKDQTCDCCNGTGIRQILHYVKD
jgi:hypothetical protein